MEGKAGENYKRIVELRKKMKRMEEEMEEMRSDMERKEKEWRAREILQQMWPGRRREKWRKG